MRWIFYLVIFMFSTAVGAQTSPSPTPPPSLTPTGTSPEVEARLHTLEVELARVTALLPTPVADADADPRADWCSIPWPSASRPTPNSIIRGSPAAIASPARYSDWGPLISFSTPTPIICFNSTSRSITRLSRRWSRRATTKSSLNLAAFGIELSRLSLGRYGGPIGRLYIQYGSNIDTDAGSDPTTARGYYLSASAFKYIQQAAAGWHFNSLHGINVEIGIFPSYIGADSYLPQENWDYLHPFIAEFTPYYFSGVRAQIYPTQRLKIELWLVNGWQTFGQWHEGRAGGYLINWRPRQYFLFSHMFYVGQDVQGDPGGVRIYTDNNAQLQVWRGQNQHQVKSVALSLVADYGYELRSNAPSGSMGGAALSMRAEWTAQWATTVRGDMYYDQTRAVIIPLPSGAPLPPTPSSFLGGGFTATMDFLPSPWLILRLEYMHRNTNFPYLSGHGGITGPNGVPPIGQTPFVPDLVKEDDRLVLNATLRL